MYYPKVPIEILIRTWAWAERYRRCRELAQGRTIMERCTSEGEGTRFWSTRESAADLRVAVVIQVSMITTMYILNLQLEREESTGREARDEYSHWCHWHFH
jgi:hypothetical protein